MTTSIFFLLFIITFIIALIVLAAITTRSSFYKRVVVNRYKPENFQLPSADIDLKSADGIDLKAWYTPAAPIETLETSKGIVLLLHGLGGMDASCLLDHASFLRRAGYHSIALDMRAHGRSGGDRMGLAIEEVGDVIAALDWIASQPALQSLPITLLGFSLGAATSIRTAAIRDDVDAVISISSFATIDQLIKDQLTTDQSLNFFLDFYLVFVRLWLKFQYGVWVSVVSPLHDIRNIAPRPILIMHGGLDRQVPVKHAYFLANSAGTNCTSWIAETAGFGIYIDEATSKENVEYRHHILEFLEQVKKYKNS